MASFCPIGAEVQIDKTALFVALTIAVLASLLAGLLPALRLSAVAPSPTLKTGGSAGASRGQHHLRAAFIATQVALALVLLVTSGLLLRVLSRLRGTDLGFDPDRLLTSEIDLSVADYENRDVIANFYQPLLGLPRPELQTYLHENISFCMNAEMQAGLDLYYKLAHKHGLIPGVKPLKSIDA